MIPACSIHYGMTVQQPTFLNIPIKLIYGSPWNSDWGNRVFIKNTVQMLLHYIIGMTITSVPYVTPICYYYTPKH